MVRTLTIRPSGCRAAAECNTLLFKLLKTSVLNLLKAKPDFNFAGDWCRMPDSKFKASLDNLSSCFKKESEKQEWGGELRGRAQGRGFYLQFPKTNNKKIVLIFFQASQEAVPEPVRSNFPSSSCLLQPPPVLARCMPPPIASLGRQI